MGCPPDNSNPKRSSEFIKVSKKGLYGALKELRELTEEVKDLRVLFEKLRDLHDIDVDPYTKSRIYTEIFENGEKLEIIEEILCAIVFLQKNLQKLDEKLQHLIKEAKFLQRYFQNQPEFFQGIVKGTEGMGK